jgi:hypothetical protein
MKRLMLSFFVFIPMMLFAQQSPVDKLFDKYSGREGYTSVFISKHLFSLFAQIDMEDKEFEELLGKLTGIKILSAEGTAQSGVNFYNEILKELPLREYTELMVVKEKGQDFKFLIREKNGKILELLMISGGINNNALISIQGDINMKNISNLSKSMNIQGFENLEKIDKK